MVQRDDIPGPLAETILARADGNPFFLEELALSVGLPTSRSEPPAVPETIHAAIESRFDRLEDAPRRLLETASILGREVSLRILRKMWSGTGSIESLLGELVRLEFLTPKRREEGIWVFKHPLIQEVAYERLQPSDRAALHGIAGRAVETLYAGRLEEAYDRLAYHYSKSGKREQAVEYLTRFADKAARSNALAEAVGPLEEAFKLAEGLGAGSQRDALLVELVLRRAQCLIFLGRLAETRELLAGERARFEASLSPSIRARYHFALAATQRFLGDREPASDNAQRALVEAASLGEDASVGKIHFELAMQSIWSGDSARGLEEAGKAAARFSQAGNPRWQGMTHWIAGVHEYLLGSFERALDSEAKATTIGRAIDDLRIQSFAAGVVGLVWAARGDWEQSLEHCEFSLSCSPDPINTACSLAFASQAHRAKGDLTKSIEQLGRAIDLMTEHQLLPMKGWATAWLAEVVLESGQRNEARELADQSLKICRRVGPPFACGLAERVLGQLAHTEGRHSKAREFLERSLQTFQGMGSEFEAGRTGMELARLARVENQPLAATEHLARAASRFEAAGARVSAARAAALAEEV
jgi:tetratricopeptide (TPR) repeat protein